MAAHNPGRHFLDLRDAGGDALAAMINDAQDRKAARAGKPKGAPDDDRPLADHVLAMIFEKESTRTRVSFDIAMRQLGGQAMVLEGDKTQLSRGESVPDTARVLSRMIDAMMIRTGDHGKIEELADHAGVPVINGLTDRSHPCQIVADLLTVVENGKALPGLEIAWLGDGNNVLYSWMEAAGLMKMRVRVAGPQEFWPARAEVDEARALGADVILTTDAGEAVRGADVVVTDTWISMGQADADAKRAALTPYQVDTKLLDQAKDDAILLHCLPAHRGEEITADAIEGARSRVFDEAENRIHAQKSVLLWAFGKL